MLAVCLIIKSCPEIHVVFFTLMFFSTIFLKLDGFCFFEVKEGMWRCKSLLGTNTSSTLLLQHTHVAHF